MERETDVRKSLAVPGFLLAMLVLAGCGAPAPVTPPAAPATDWAADDAAIRAALDASVEAFNRGDLAAHLAIYAPGVTFMTQDGPRPGVEPIERAFREKYFGADGLPIQPLRFEQLATRRLADDAALSTGRFILSGGDRPELSGWFTLVWERTLEGWRAVHDHSS